LQWAADGSVFGQLTTDNGLNTMATEVVMPQMGESIAEGTITKWLKNVGDHVDRDEPLFEISTDKVDAEIPSPAAGTLTEIKHQEGETVEVNTVVAVLDGAGAQPATAPPAGCRTTGHQLSKLPPRKKKETPAPEQPKTEAAPPPPPHRSNDQSRRITTDGTWCSAGAPRQN
jgi:2-oxoglutarate dehydrogenase E2 component (dihydrolipoamide succinyltransferase)